MTVVAVKKTEKSIHLACDTMLSYWRWHTSKTTGSSNIKDFSKIGAINDITYWFSGYIEDMLVLKQYLKLNNLPWDRLDDIEEYILNFYKHCKDRNSDWSPDISIILIYKSKVFCVNNYMICEIAEYDAIWSV